MHIPSPPISRSKVRDTKQSTPPRTPIAHASGIKTIGAKQHWLGLADPAPHQDRTLAEVPDQLAVFIQLSEIRQSVACRVRWLFPLDSPVDVGMTGRREIPVNPEV